jgi:hypothetical protein
VIYKNFVITASIKLKYKLLFSQNLNLVCIFIKFQHITSMGTYRSEPEVTKHTHTGTFEKITYSISHMCGNSIYLY